MYIYIFIYIYTYIYKYIYIYKYVHIYVYTYVHMLYINRLWASGAVEPVPDSVKRRKLRNLPRWV